MSFTQHNGDRLSIFLEFLIRSGEYQKKMTMRDIVETVNFMEFFNWDLHALEGFSIDPEEQPPVLTREMFMNAVENYDHFEPEENFFELVFKNDQIEPVRREGTRYAPKTAETTTAPAPEL